MEHLVRVHNEQDRQTLKWLRRHVGDAALAAAVERCAGSGKPYLSSVCRQLGVKTPGFHLPRRESPSPVAEQSLAAIRGILAARKASTVATNVPGPQMPLYLAGCEVREMMFWVPQNGTIGMGLSILSYNGRVHFGVIADARRVPDPEPLVQRFAREVEKLTLITLMEDWDGKIGAADAEATLRHYA